MNRRDNGSANVSSTVGNNLPQDPFFPHETPTGPSFLDTLACLCALQSTPDPNGNGNVAWQCIGNQIQGVYQVTTDKWFNSLHGGSNATNLSIDDASNPPITSEALVWNSSNNTLVPATDLDALSPYDEACTGQNQTTFSTAFYRAAAEQS